MRKRIVSRLLKLRSDFEKSKKNELLVSVAKRIDKQKEIADIKKKYTKASEEFNEVISKGVPSSHLASFLQYFGGARSDIKRKEKELKNLVSEEENKRTEYIEMRKERQIAENLKNRIEKMETTKQQKRNEKILDDSVLSKFSIEKNEKK